MSDAPSRRDQGSLCPKRPSRRYASDRQKPWRRLPSTLFRDELRQSNQIVGGGSEGEGRARFDHGERRYPLGMAVSRRQTSINQKAMAVLHQAMADEAELGFLAWSLAVQPCIGIRRRDMRLVRPLLSMEIGFGIAPATGRRLVRSVPWLKALQRSPRFDQRPVDREVVGG